MLWRNMGISRVLKRSFDNEAGWKKFNYLFLPIMAPSKKPIATAMIKGEHKRNSWIINGNELTLALTKFSRGLAMNCSSPQCLHPPSTIKKKQPSKSQSSNITTNEIPTPINPPLSHAFIKKIKFGYLYTLWAVGRGKGARIDISLYSSYNTKYLNTLFF